MAGIRYSWRRAFAVYAQPQVLGMICLGFSAGLPFILVSSTLSAWLADANIDLAVIGYISLIGVVYSIKVFWAPIVDRMPLVYMTRRFGKRRAWMLLAQIGIAFGLWGMSLVPVEGALSELVWLAIGVAFCSATQDVVIDAYRVEVVAVEMQGAMAATYVLGYRLALLVAGAGALYLAEFWDWRLAYRVMALSMSMGIIATLLLPEPVVNLRGHDDLLVVRRQSLKERWRHWLSKAVIEPFVDFFRRRGRHALLVLALIALYKMSDIAMGVMANPFYLDLGFSKKQIADVTKVFGFFMTIFGASLGGVLVAHFGVMRPLLLGAIVVAATNLLFAVLALSQPNLYLLAAVISADNLSGGIATAAFIAYLSGLTSAEYTATQYALFSSLMTLPSKLVGAFSGQIVAEVGYAGFFVYAAVIGLPAVLLVMLLMRSGTLDAAGSFAGSCTDND